MTTPDWAAPRTEAGRRLLALADKAESEGHPEWARGVRFALGWDNEESVRNDLSTTPEDWPEFMEAVNRRG